MTIILLGGVLIIMKLSRKNLLPSVIQSVTDQDSKNTILQENEELIKRVIILCEANDNDSDVIATKMASIFDDYLKWNQKNISIIKQKPELADKIEHQWIELIYKLASSLTNESDELKKEKKLAVIAIIEKQIKSENLINYLKNKPEVNQKALAEYIQNKTEAKKPRNDIPISVMDFLKN